MPLLTLSLGSNIQPSKNVLLAVDRLRARFGEVRCSTVYESEAVGFSGDNFLNLVVATETDEDVAGVNSFLKQLEDEFGRDRSAPKFSGRTMDIDILSYGDLCGSHGGVNLPRGEILQHAFVLQPLAQLLPEARHPELDKSYSQLWQEFDHPEQKLWAIEFDWGAN